jgi:hypothetical protein
MSELRPCYFKHEIKSGLYLADNIGEDFGGNTPYTEFWVQCDDCGARGPTANTEEEAIAAWRNVWKDQG